MKPREAEESEVRDPRTYAIIGAAMEVHRELGPGFLESVYQEALSIELTERGIPHQSEVDLSVRYKEKNLRSKYRADIVCFNEILLELKAIPKLSKTEIAQIIHYLTATAHPLGLLINFGGGSLEFKRFVV